MLKHLLDILNPIHICYKSLLFSDIYLFGIIYWNC